MPIVRITPFGMRLLLGLALIVVTWLSLTPQAAPMPAIPMADKWAHGLTYLGLALLVDKSWPNRRFGWPEWASLLAYGLVIELLQSQIPNRLFSLGDLLANATGIALYGLLVAPLLHGKGSR